MLVAIDVSRSDLNVANWFVIQSPKMAGLFGPLYNQILLTSDDPWTYLKDDEYCKPDLYGDRKMEVIINQVPNDHPITIGRIKADQLEPLKRTWEDWIKKRRETLARFNREAVLWENGTVTLRGDEAIKPGRYLCMTRGEFEQSMYLTGVTHTFQPYHSYTTTAQFIRGSGWVKRQRLPGNPSLQERDRA